MLTLICCEFRYDCLAHLLSILTDEQLVAADVDLSSSTTINDVTYIQQYLNGIIVIYLSTIDLCHYINTGE